MRNYFLVNSVVNDKFKKLMKSGNCEKIVLNFMNLSKVIFPGSYIHIENQSHGECDIIEKSTGEKFDVKLPLTKKQGENIGKRMGNVSMLAKELHAEAVEFSQCYEGKTLKEIKELKLYQIMASLLNRTKEDENVIFFIPYPIVFDFEHFPLIGASDLLKKVYKELCANLSIDNKKVFAIYISFDKKVVLRNLITDEREYISSPDIEEYVSYNIHDVK